VPKLILLGFLVLFVSLAGSEIYKWTDETGTVHYGDCPPPQCKSEKLETHPGPSAEESRQARERAERLIQEQKKREISAKVNKVPTKREAGQSWEAECYSSAKYVIGPVRANPSRQMIPRALTSSEYNKLFRMLRSFKGRWRGHIDEVVCLGAEDDPRKETRRYDVDASISRNLDNILTIESEIQRVDSKTHQSQILWLLLKKYWLRFGDMVTIKYDAPQWDVDVISVNTNMFMFMRKFRRAGQHNTSLQHIELRSLHVSHRMFKLREWFYVQGSLVKMRTWVLDRLR
jgi:hypothetical protein